MPALPLGIIGFNNSHPFIPRYDLIHVFKKLFPFGFLLPEAVFDVSEGPLLYYIAPPFLDEVVIPYIKLWQWLSLNQGFHNLR